MNYQELFLFLYAHFTFIRKDRQQHHQNKCFLFGCDKLLEESHCALSHSLQGRSKSHSPASSANLFTTNKVLIFPLFFHHKSILRRLGCKPEEMEKSFCMPILMLCIYSEYQCFLSTVFVEYMMNEKN